MSSRRSPRFITWYIAPGYSMRSLRGTEAGCHRRPQVSIVRTDTCLDTCLDGYCTPSFLAIAPSSCQKPVKCQLLIYYVLTFLTMIFWANTPPPFVVVKSLYGCIDIQDSIRFMRRRYSSNTSDPSIKTGPNHQ